MKHYALTSRHPAFIILLLVMLFCSSAQANAAIANLDSHHASPSPRVRKAAVPEDIVWKDVMWGYANMRGATIESVSFFPDRTEILIHMQLYRGYEFCIAPQVHLAYDGYQFPVIKATGINLGEKTKMTTSSMDIKLTFEAMPLGVSAFDLVEPGGCFIRNIRSSSLLPEGLADTYWRNDATGEWLLGITPHKMIYNNQVVDIITHTEKNGNHVFCLKDGTTVSVGKMKAGQRAIRIGKASPVQCSPIITHTLPDYPVPDDRIGFATNDYGATDTITIQGWLKDMPEYAWNKGRNIRTFINNPFMNRHESILTPLSADGRFTLRIPVVNTTEIYFDYDRSDISTIVEPGHTYFFVYDFLTGHRLWMGSDSRLQNELLSMQTCYATMGYIISQGVELLPLLAQSDSVAHIHEAHLTAIHTAHPNISRRYLDYQTDSYRMTLARDLVQACFYSRDSVIPQSYIEHMTANYWRNLPEPLTIADALTSFMYDYTNTLLEIKQNVSSGNAAIAAVSSSSSSSDNTTTTASLLSRLDATRRLLVTLDSSQAQKDFVLTHLIYNNILVNRRPLPQQILKYIDDNIALPSARAFLYFHHNRFLPK
ncbi:MAG: hypothetical protein J5663_01200 [Bacteroidaceae bacterium]|nr:hypothetical protein [Bacteroidaceae bacterium]